MKTLDEYLFEQEIRDILNSEEITEGLFGKLVNLFKSGVKSFGKATHTLLSDLFQDTYPEWYKTYEEVKNESNQKSRIKTIQRLIDAIDKMRDFKNYTEGAAKKLVVLYDQMDDAKQNNMDDVIKFCQQKIDEIIKEQPKAAELAQKELKDAEAGKVEKIDADKKDEKNNEEASSSEVKQADVKEITKDIVKDNGAQLKSIQNLTNVSFTDTYKDMLDVLGLKAESLEDMLDDETINEAKIETIEDYLKTRIRNNKNSNKTQNSVDLISYVTTFLMTGKAIGAIYKKSPSMKAKYSKTSEFLIGLIDVFKEKCID